MKKWWYIIAYAEEHLPRKETVVAANTHAEAEAIGWRKFPEYHEIGVYEMEKKK